MLKYILTAVIFLLIALFAAVLAVDLWRNRGKLRHEPGKPLLLCVMTPVIMFFPPWASPTLS